MDKHIIIEGKRYRLVPDDQDIVDAYVKSSGVAQSVERLPVKEKDAGSSPVPRAVPKISDYRERFKKKQVRINEITATPQIATNLPKLDSELDSYTYKGDRMFFGEGTVREY